MTLENLGYTQQFESPYVKIYSKVTDEYGLVVIHIAVGHVSKTTGIYNEHPVSFTSDEFKALANINVLPQESTDKYCMD